MQDDAYNDKSASDVAGSGHEPETPASTDGVKEDHGKNDDEAGLARSEQNRPAPREGDTELESEPVTEQTVTQQIERAKIAIEYADNLKPEEKAEATLALTDAERAAKDGNTQSLAERLGRALEIASKGAGVAKATLEIAPMIIGLLPHA